MAFHDRQYCCYLILGDQTLPAIWNWPRWLSLAEAFDSVVKNCRGKPNVRVNQYTKEEKPNEVKFGRLVWSHDSFEKWTHGSPATALESRNWNFIFAEAVAPSLPVCARDDKPPDFFMTVTNEGYFRRNIQLAFNPRVFVAIATDLPKEVLSDCRSAVESAVQLTSAKFTATIVRPWGYSFGSTGVFTRAIQDIAHVGLFKLGQPHLRPLSLATLEENWEILGDNHSIEK